MPCGCSIGVMSCASVRPQPRGVRRRGLLKGSEQGPRCRRGCAAHPLAFKSNDGCRCGTAACQLGPCQLSRDGCDGPSAARTPWWLFAGTQPGLPEPWGRCWGVWRQTASQAHQLLFLPSPLLCHSVLAVRVGRSSQMRGAQTRRRWPHISERSEASRWGWLNRHEPGCLCGSSWVMVQIRQSGGWTCLFGKGT